MSTYVIIPAAGQGKRMGGRHAKQYLELRGVPILVWTVRAFQAHPQVAGLVVAVPPGDEARVAALLTQHGCATGVQVVAGGSDRQASVAAALSALPADCDVVLVHDAARPLVSRDVIDRVIAAAGNGPVTAAVPVHETIKRVNGDLVEETLDRSTLWSIQTPQGFPRALLDAAHQAAGTERATDDCVLVERLGVNVRVVPGAPENIKITTPADLPVAALWLEEKCKTAKPSCPGIGLGYDVHRLVAGRALVLGGVPIAYEYGLLGHSDADVLLHAVMDALLGAAGLGDIGQHFPDHDPAYAGISSLLLLQRVADLLAVRNLRPCGVDVVLIAQKPRIAPYTQAMRANIAGVLQLPVEAVNVKATTNEKLGFVGREEGIAAQAVARVQ